MTPASAGGLAIGHAADTDKDAPDGSTLPASSGLVFTCRPLLGMVKARADPITHDAAQPVSSGGARIALRSAAGVTHGLQASVVRRLIGVIRGSLPTPIADRITGAILPTRLRQTIRRRPGA